MIDNSCIAALADYAVSRGLLTAEDRVWAENLLMDDLGLSAPEALGSADGLEAITGRLLDDAVKRGIIGDTVTERDLLYAKLMGRVTMAPSAVQREFCRLLELDPEKATDWFHRFCTDCGYIRADRTSRDLRWESDSKYGRLELSINLSKPEKDPRAIAAAGKGQSSAYPACALCMENEGYAGRPDHPARQNLRIIPMELEGESWAFQYSPYAYYREHCILLNQTHRPMTIHEGVFRKLFAFLDRFPHYFIGSNADLPIVGGSILSHEHFQGGRHCFAMELAPAAMTFTLPAFPETEASVLHWPMTVLRLKSADREALAAAGGHVLRSWKNWSDPEANILCKTGNTPHNTITPIARRQAGKYVLDLVLRNNRTSQRHPLGIFHPHEDKHHIKKENIGLIEVMGLAVLPGRLKQELALLGSVMAAGGDLTVPAIAHHELWAREILKRVQVTAENAEKILLQETGKVFAQCLEDCGVFPETEAGRAGLERFLFHLTEV